MAADEETQRSEARREGAPAAALALAVFVLLALVSRSQSWELVGLPWWIWLVLCVPALLLTIDLVAGSARRSRAAALALAGFLVAGNLVALGILVAGLVSTSTNQLSGGELLLTGFALYTVDVAVFGLIFWEVEAGGPGDRRMADEREARDFRFPQDDGSTPSFEPKIWDYLYVSLTNSIAFSPTDTMPVSHRAKALMSLESLIAAVSVLLVAARAVNVLGS